MTIHPRVLVQLVDKDTKDSAQSLRAAEISENEYRSGNTSPERVQEALEVFHRDGIVPLSNAIAHAPLDGLREHMIQDLSEVLEWTGVQYNQGRATKNISQCPQLSGEFVSEEIWANPHAVAVIERLISLVPQLVHVGGNTALPNGRDRQAVHSDIQPPHPDFTFGVEANIFLESMSAANGVTEFWHGPHSNSKPADQDLNAISRGLIRKQKVEERRPVAPPIQPEIAKGSIVLRDLRLWHSEMPNYSLTPRMTLGFVFFPSWYRPPMRLTLPTSIRPVLESWKSIDAVTTSNFIDGPADHLRIPFGLNLNQTIEGDRRELLSKVEGFVATCMRQYDLSHDHDHILRVLNLAKRITSSEYALHPDVVYDGNLIKLTCLLHGVGDRKYLAEGEVGSTMVESFLIQNGASLELAQKVQYIVSHVSYTRETRAPNGVQAALLKSPELAIVQDSDRLDAIGAIGIGRCFAFAVAKRSEQGMKGAVVHFVDKLEKLESMMKTGTGTRMARLRTEKIKAFRGWWEDELNVQD